VGRRHRHQAGRLAAGRGRGLIPWLACAPPHGRQAAPSIVRRFAALGKLDPAGLLLAPRKLDLRQLARQGSSTPSPFGTAAPLGELDPADLRFHHAALDGGWPADVAPSGPPRPAPLQPAHVMGCHMARTGARPGPLRSAHDANGLHGRHPRRRRVP
jgi:hypothetical protein